MFAWGSPFALQILQALSISSLVICRNLNNQMQRGQKGARRDKAVEGGLNSGWTSVNRTLVMNTEINSQYYHACFLIYLLWLLPSLEKAVGTNPAHWLWDLIPGALLWWQSLDANEVGYVGTQQGSKQRLSTTVLSSPLSFHERTQVPFITYVASLFLIDEVKSKQKFWYCYHPVSSTSVGN